MARDLGAGWLQLDTLWTAMKAAVDHDPSAFSVLDVAERMRRGGDSDSEMLAALVAAAEGVCAVLPEVFACELETHPVLMADGAWLLPSFIAGLQLPDTEVSAVFLQHADVDAIATALASRLDGPPQERHLRMNRQICQYGAWLGEQATACDLPVLDPLPFSTLIDRARATLVI